MNYTRLKQDEETIETYLQRMNQLYRVAHDMMVHGLTHIPEGMDAEAAQAAALMTLGYSEDVSRWMVGDEIITMRKKNGANKSYRFVAQIIGKSDRWSLELYRVSVAFPTDTRYYGVPWQLYRMCVGAPRPMDALISAIGKNIPVSEMESYLRRYRAIKRDQKSSPTDG